MSKRKKKYIIVASILIVLLTAAFTFAESFSSEVYDAEDIKMEKINKSPRYKDGKFLNYNTKPDMNIANMLPILKEFLFVNNNRKPDVQLPVKQIDMSKISNTKNDELKVTWVGHSSQIINIDGKLIITDPVYENKTFFIGPARYNGEVPLNIDELPEIDLVLISHNHYDHLNKGTIQQIHSKVKSFIVPLMVGAELESMGVPREKITELSWWEETIPFEDFMIALTPTQHFSGRGIFDTDKSLWGSYVIQGPNHKIYFSGDSGYFEGFKEIGNKYGPFDYTFLECGAYNKKWHFVHMMPEETVQAHIDLKGKILHPIHWGTFNLALHAWYDPMVRITKAAEENGIKLSTPIVGETITVDENLETEKWWTDYINPQKDSASQIKELKFVEN